MYKILSEATLVKVANYMRDHDTGVLTAWLGELNYKENRQRNYQLLADLRSAAIPLTIIGANGIWVKHFDNPDPKTHEPHKERVFFVVDVKNTGKLRGILEDLGKKYNQESVLYIPKSGANGILIGTREDGWPGLGKVVNFPKRTLGHEAQFMTKLGANRPFAFLENTRYNEWGPVSAQSAYFAEKIRHTPWKELVVPAWFE